MPSVLQSLCRSIIDERFFFLLIQICIIANVALILIDITASQVNPHKFSWGPSLLAGGGDGIAPVAFIALVFVIPTAPWHAEMHFVICGIVVYQDVRVSGSDLRLLKRYFGDQIVKKNTIVNMRCFHVDDHGRRWVLRLLDLTLDCGKSVFIHPLLVALR